MSYTLKRKKHLNDIHHLLTEDGNGKLVQGWLVIKITGKPYERGFQHGVAAANEFAQVQETLKFLCWENLAIKWEDIIEIARVEFSPRIKNNFYEFYQEMQGIADGCISVGTQTSVDEIIAWNNYITIVDCFLPNGKGEPRKKTESCSAFIATGSYTKDGKIVIAHNSFCEFADGQYYNVILDITPSSGHRILMQTSPCSIWSGTDVFVTSSGIFGTETTIGGFNKYKHNDTIACRIRNAMQYGNSFEDYRDLLLLNNSGDYANTWLFGNIHTNEICQLELGLEYHDFKVKSDGVFCGYNLPMYPPIRNFECSNTGYCDIRRHGGSRQVRIPQLVEQYKGKIDVSIAKRILSDHYDVYLNKNNPCSRTICSHYELDAREYMSDPSRPLPYQPRGAIDGAIMTTDMAKKMSFLMKYGSSCNIPFMCKPFLKKHPQWKKIEKYLWDRPVRNYVLFKSKII